MSWRLRRLSIIAAPTKMMRASLGFENRWPFTTQMIRSYALT